MNSLDLSFDLWIVALAAGLTLWACYYFVRVIIYAIQEAGVRNGLITLRKQLLLICSLLIYVNTIGLTLIITQPLLAEPWKTGFSTFVVMTVRFGFLIIALTIYKIYTQQYTPQQKEFHKKIEKLEEGRDRRDVRREVARKKLNRTRRAATVRRNK